MIHDAGLRIGDFCNGPLQKLINLIPSEDVSCINLILYIVETLIIAVGNDGMALCLELGEVIDYETAEEGASVFKSWLINDNIGTLGLDTLHDALNGRLAEVVGTRFHGQAIEADGD